MRTYPTKFKRNHYSFWDRSIWTSKLVLMAQNCISDTVGQPIRFAYGHNFILSISCLIMASWMFTIWAFGKILPKGYPKGYTIRSSGSQKSPFSIDELPHPWWIIHATRSVCQRVSKWGKGFLQPPLQTSPNRLKLRFPGGYKIFPKMVLSAANIPSSLAVAFFPTMIQENWAWLFLVMAIHPMSPTWSFFDRSNIQQLPGDQSVIVGHDRSPWLHTMAPQLQLPKGMAFDVLRSASEHRQPIRWLFLAYRLDAATAQTFQWYQVWVTKGQPQDLDQKIHVIRSS